MENEFLRVLSSFHAWLKINGQDDMNERVTIESSFTPILSYVRGLQGCGGVTLSAEGRELLDHLDGGRVVRRTPHDLHA